MKQKQKPMSFSLHPDNINYVEMQVIERRKTYSRYHRSMYIDDLLTHLRTKGKTIEAPKAKRKQVSYPSNLDEQFLLLWETKGKKGKKQGAYDIFRKMCVDVTDDICEQATLLMITDLHKNKHEAGYPERHLTSYLNGKFWEQ